MPTLFSSPATLSLLALTVAVSLIGFSVQKFWWFLALEPHRMRQSGQYHPLITSGFVHADLTHLFINMLTLFFFGPTLEATVGGDRFLLIYFISLVCGSLYPFVKYRNDPSYVAIGASGAISGLLFSFCLFYPLELIYVFFFVPMPAILFAVLYVIYSWYSMRNRKDNIGHEAHLAGAIGGIATTFVLVPEVIAHLGTLL